VRERYLPENASARPGDMVAGRAAGTAAEPAGRLAEPGSRAAEAAEGQTSFCPLMVPTEVSFETVDESVPLSVLSQCALVY